MPQVRANGKQQTATGRRKRQARPSVAVRGGARLPADKPGHAGQSRQPQLQRRRQLQQGRVVVAPRRWDCLEQPAGRRLRGAGPALAALQVCDFASSSVNAIYIYGRIHFHGSVTLSTATSAFFELIWQNRICD